MTTSVTKCSAPALSLSVNHNNRITNTGFSYDAAGNLLGDGTNAYTWDAESRMKTAAGVTYLYDGDGKRVQQSPGTSGGKLYWYGTSSDPLVETDAAGHNCTEFVFFNGKRIARGDPNGTVFYFFADHLGSSRVVTNATGGIVEDSDYYPFGGERVVVDALNNPYKFTGKERDGESSLDFFNARYYSSSLGRFLSPDPDNAGSLEEDPQRWNGYSYARNNPLLYTDPDGTDVRICIDGQDECFTLTDQQYKDLLKEQQGKQGITLPEGQFPSGDILCGGQKCGTAQYFEPGLADDYVIPAVVGGIVGAIRGGIRGLLGSGASNAGKEAVAGAASGVASAAGRGTGQVLIQGTKAAVREALESGVVNSAQRAAIKSELRRGAAQAKYALEKLADGTVRLTREVPGRAGWQAIYEKVIDASGETVSVIQKGFDASGKLVHFDVKYVRQ